MVVEPLRDAPRMALLAWLLSGTELEAVVDVPVLEKIGQALPLELLVRVQFEDR